MCAYVCICVHMCAYVCVCAHTRICIAYTMCTRSSAGKPPTVCVHEKLKAHLEWLQLVGSLKLQVCFAEYRLFYRALLQKRPIILRSLLIVATPQQDLPTQKKKRSRCGLAYRVASVSRIDKMINLFCKRALSKRRYSAKETYKFIVPSEKLKAHSKICPHTKKTLTLWICMSHGTRHI